jgi:hypothetical protein
MELPFAEFCSLAITHTHVTQRISKAQNSSFRVFKIPGFLPNVGEVLN